MKRRDFLATTAGAALGLQALASQVKAGTQKLQQSGSHYDVAVIGVGSMGSPTCYYLAKAGHRVLGLEQFDISHDQGSHAGQSRLIRKAYFEHPDYVPLLQRAYDNWKSLEQLTQSKVYEKTGIVYLSTPDNILATGVHKSSELYKVPIETPSLAEARRQFPAFKIPDNFEVIVERDAGFVTPERAIMLYAREAMKLGADIHTREGVKEWKAEGGKIKITTDKGVYTCDKLVISAGAWANKMIPNLNTELKVTKQMLAWVSPKNWEAFSLGNFPCWILEDPERGSYYGFPIVPVDKFGGPMGFKLAHHFAGDPSDPDHVNREVSKGTEEDIHYALKKYLPEADYKILSLKSCLYTWSKDENFIIDHLPGYQNKVTLACGFSGHGFKFASAIGEVLADMAMKGKSDLPIDFLRLSRFS